MTSLLDTVKEDDSSLRADPHKPPDSQWGSVFKGLDCVPAYLTEYRATVDLDISLELIEFISEIDHNWEKWTTEYLHESFQRVLSMYRAEKGEANCPDTLSLLSMLFWEVTGRTKVGETAAQHGKKIPYWGLNIFNYCLILGRAEPEVAAISWKLTSGDGLPVNPKSGTAKIPVASVVELYNIVKKVAKAKKLPEKDVYRDAIVVTKEQDTTGELGLNRLWSSEVQNAILKHFDLPPLRPRGSRKRKDQGQTLPPSDESQDSSQEKQVPRVPEMAPVKLRRRGRKRKPRPEEAKPTRATYPEEQRIASEISTLVKQFMELRLPEVSPEHHGSLQEMTITMSENALAYFNARCNRIVIEQREMNGVQARTAALNERAKYEEACRSDYFGYELKPKEIVDYDRYLKKSYKQQSRDYHPDRHPEHLAKYIELQKFNEIIVTYNEKHKTATTKKRRKDAP
jgi:hypothetical protein